MIPPLWNIESDPCRIGGGGGRWLGYGNWGLRLLTCKGAGGIFINGGGLEA